MLDDIESLGVRIRDALVEQGLPKVTTRYGMGRSYYGQSDVKEGIKSLNEFLIIHGYHVELDGDEVTVTRNGRYYHD